MKYLSVDIKRLHLDVHIPQYATDGSSGFDFEAFIPEPIVIKKMHTTLIPTGIAIAMPEGFELQVRSRSGLTYKKGLVVKNSPGTIDCDYRGEIKIILYNSGSEDVVINRYDKIAQGVFCPIIRGYFSEVTTLSDTIRGSGGFGSTGF